MKRYLNLNNQLVLYLYAMLISEVQEKNLGAFENYLNILKHEFTVIGLTETWLNDNDFDLYGLSDYKVIDRHRVNRTGGGVAVCIQDQVSFRERPDLSCFTEDFETVFIEIEKGNQLNAKNVIIGVIYRPPNQDILSFNEKLNDIINKIRMENKICYLLGDYNINILNYSSHVHTAQFVDMMSSSGFLPLITRPTRVTATSATLIDNIFTNNLMDISHSLQRLFITDVSDHFPIFHVSRRMQMSDVDVYMYKRLFSLKNKEEFYHAVNTTNWDEIDRATDTQQAFDLFHSQLTELYDKHFPKVRIKRSIATESHGCLKVWKTPSGIRINYTWNVKRSNLLLMKNFIKLRRENCSNSWKWRKSIIIMIYLLNTVMIWKNHGVSYKNIINKYQKPQTQSRFKIGDNLITSDKNIICNKFNDFFVNIGPTVAKSIPKVNKSPLSYMGNRLTNLYIWNQLLKKKLIHW